MGSIFKTSVLLLCGACYAAAYAIRGLRTHVKESMGLRPLRPNILDLAGSGAPWDLYIQALLNYSQTDHSQQLSNYQISGIHGYPRAPWDGVNGTGPGIGYCSHSSVLFPLWHRPYLMLYEEMLGRVVGPIAAQYPQADRQRYENAAGEFRIPYWDWSTSARLPEIVTVDNLTINTPQGNQTVRNPLKQFDFEPGDQDGWSDDRPKFDFTVRTPDTAGNCKKDVVNAGLTQNWEHLHNSMYTVLASVTNWTTFASSAVSDPDTPSIESIHGYVHSIVGGYLSGDTKGHMTLFPYSAFDPIFMLHHANVDRLVAIWQAMHPDSWITPTKSQGDTYMSASGTLEDANTPLWPFRKDDQGAFHTANSVRYLQDLGYDYFDAQDWVISLDAPVTDAEIARRATERVNLLFHPEQFNTSNVDGANTTQGQQLQNPHAKPGVGGLPYPSAALAAPTEWTLRVILHGALERPTTVTLRGPGHDGAPLATLLLDPRTDSPFAPLQRVVPLGSALLAAPGGADNLRPDRVLTFLCTVRWEAADLVAGLAPGAAGGSGGASSKVVRFGATLLFDVAARPVEPPQKVDELPTYGEWKVHGRMKLADGGLLAPA